MKGTSPWEKENSLAWKSSHSIEGVDLAGVERHVRLVNIDIVILRHFSSMFSIQFALKVIDHLADVGSFDILPHDKHFPCFQIFFSGMNDI